jgi:hypothetical protein
MIMTSLCAIALMLQSSAAASNQMTVEQAHKIITDDVVRFNDEAKKARRPGIYVAIATPHQTIDIPTGQRFEGNSGEVVAGIHFQCYIIAINPSMVGESQLSTYFHELGHSIFSRNRPRGATDADDEAFAISYSLKRLDSAGFPNIARDEVKKVRDMANREPYRTAVKQLASDKYWKKFSKN